MAKKIIKTKKPNIKSAKVKNKKILTLKQIKPKKQSKLQKNVVKNNKTTKPSKTIIKKTINQPTPKITSSQKVIISKPKIKKNLIKKINKKPTNSKLKNTKIKEKQKHWFKKILKSIRNTIIVILPLILIILALWFVITNFFPEVAAKIGPVAQAAWGKTKSFVNWINKHGTDFIKWLELPSKFASAIFSGIVVAVGLILGLICFVIPVIGLFVGGAILIATTIHTGITWWDNQQTPKDDLPPQSLVEVRNLDDQNREEAKLNQELSEYATKLTQEGKSQEEIKQKINERIEEVKELQKKKKTQKLN